MLSLLLVLGLAGQDACHAIEFTPFTGYGIGGEFTESQSDQEVEVSDNGLYGFAVDFDLGESGESQFEVYLSRQETRLVGDNLSTDTSAFGLDVDYYHIGGILQGTGEYVRPFAVGTLGVTYLNPKSSLHDSIVRPSLGLGGGVKLFPTENIGLRLEGRGDA